MGILNILFGNSKQIIFKPNFKISEYENHMNFLSSGGTTNGWKQLKSRNNWRFEKDDTDIFMQYQEELKPISDKYYTGMEKIQHGWSEMYNSKDYSGKRAVKYESDCKVNIQLYKQMVAIEKRYGDHSPKNVPAYKRLAMLYEKQREFESSITVCIDALRDDVNKDDMRARLVRMIKKAGISPTTEEIKLLK